MNAPRDRLSSGLRRAELAEVRQAFGVGTEQVRRDHVISYVLHVLSEPVLRDQLVFIGGTALSRTFLPTLRLSEDIDLLVHGRRAAVVEDVQALVERGLRRVFAGVSWDPSPAVTRGAAPARLVVDDRLGVQVQLLAADGYPAWPTEEREIEQRYSDVPPARLRTLTAEAFAAAKAAVWMDRHAPRDLADLYGLAQIGAITRGAAELFGRLGPTGAPPASWMFSEAPTEEAWRTALSHQGRMPVGPHEALARVADAWASAAR